MSKQIDMSDPNAWTEEERSYLASRSWLLGRAGLPADTLDQLDQGYFVHPDEEAPQEEEEEEVGGYDAMTNNDLRILLVQRNLSVGGTKAELIARLEANDVESDDEDDDDTDEAEDDEEDDA